MTTTTQTNASLSEPGDAGNKTHHNQASTVLGISVPQKNKNVMLCLVAFISVIALLTGFVGGFFGSFFGSFTAVAVTSKGTAAESVPDSTCIDHENPFQLVENVFGILPSNDTHEKMTCPELIKDHPDFCFMSEKICCASCQSSKMTSRQLQATPSIPERFYYFLDKPHGPIKLFNMTAQPEDLADRRQMAANDAPAPRRLDGHGRELATAEISYTWFSNVCPDMHYSIETAGLDNSIEVPSFGFNWAIQASSDGGAFCRNSISRRGAARGITPASCLNRPIRGIHGYTFAWAAGTNFHWLACMKDCTPFVIKCYSLW